MNEYKAHLFVCTNAPDKDGKCGHKNSENMRRSLKERCTKEFGKDVRVNMSGCLGFCERGITAVIYPQSKWFFDLKTTDEEKLFQAVKDVVSETNK